MCILTTIHNIYELRVCTPTLGGAICGWVGGSQVSGSTLSVANTRTTGNLRSVAIWKVYEYLIWWLEVTTGILISLNHL